MSLHDNGTRGFHFEASLIPEPGLRRMRGLGSATNSRRTLEATPVSVNGGNRAHKQHHAQKETCRRTGPTHGLRRRKMFATDRVKEKSGHRHIPPEPTHPELNTCVHRDVGLDAGMHQTPVVSPKGWERSGGHFLTLHSYVVGAHITWVTSQHEPWPPTVGGDWGKGSDH